MTFDTGNPRWFEWLSRELLSSGAEHPSAELLRRFLGRAPSPDALSPWAGFAVLLGYGILTLAIGGLLLVRRDA